MAFSFEYNMGRLLSQAYSGQVDVFFGSTKGPGLLTFPS